MFRNTSEKVRCGLCGKVFKVISSTHLRVQHSLSISEYVKSFGHQGVGFSLNVVYLPKEDPRHIKWRKGLANRETAWSRGFTKETHPGVAKISRTFKKRKLDNFYDWREKAKKKGIIKRHYRPLIKNRDLAFLVGMILGDGNIHRFERTEGLRIALASKNPALVDYTRQVIKRVFKKDPSVKKVKNSECFTVTLYEKYISRRLRIPCGNRARYIFSIPKWILRNRQFIISFLRGLFEAEGSLSVHLPTCTYNFAFSNTNSTLLKSVENLVKLLGYHPEVRPRAVRLRRKKEVESFRRLIHFRMY